MPKKQGRNAFWHFMTEWKMHEERNGRNFPNGFRDVQADPACNEAWRALTPDQKTPFVTKAKRGKDEMIRTKRTGTGESIQAIKDEEKRLEDFRHNMDAHIRHTISRAKKYNALPSTTFYFIHMNWYYMRQPDVGPVDYCPAEFAVAEFSLEDGITRHYHEIIKTDLHLGYTREALETSESSHKLHWNLPIGEDDWSTMYRKLFNFLKPGMQCDKLPPIYTRQKITHVLPSLLRRMTNAVGEPEDIFLVYTIESLFANMLRAVSDFAESNVVGVIAETQLSKELFAFTPNIECDYHKTQDNTSQFCSLSIVKQWGFTFCDHCCQQLGIDMIPGIHSPEATEMFSCNKTLNSSYRSLVSDRSMSVLSATGVSEQHRIRVSERDRGEEARRRSTIGSVEIIDHSLKSEKERSPSPSPSSPSPSPFPSTVPPIAIARPLRTPITASQALMGLSRDAPIFDGTNFPAIGGRGAPVRRADTSNRLVGPVWSHRGRKNSDSD